MSVPTIQDIVSKALNLELLWSLVASTANAIKAEVPDSGPAVDKAFADFKSQAAAYFNQPAVLAALAEAKAQTGSLLKTGESAAPPDAGDMVG